MVDGKDELAMDQLGAVSGGTTRRLVEIEPVKPPPGGPGGPVPVPYPNIGIKPTKQ